MVVTTDEQIRKIEYYRKQGYSFPQIKKLAEVSYHIAYKYGKDIEIDPDPVDVVGLLSEVEEAVNYKDETNQKIIDAEESFAEYLENNSSTNVGVSALSIISEKYVEIIDDAGIEGKDNLIKHIETYSEWISPFRNGVDKLDQIVEDLRTIKDEPDYSAIGSRIDETILNLNDHARRYWQGLLQDIASDNLESDERLERKLETVRLMSQPISLLDGQFHVVQATVQPDLDDDAIVQPDLSDDSEPSAEYQGFNLLGSDEDRKAGLRAYFEAGHTFDEFKEDFGEDVWKQLRTSAVCSRNNVIRWANVPATELNAPDTPNTEPSVEYQGHKLLGDKEERNKGLKAYFNEDHSLEDFKEDFGKEVYDQIWRSVVGSYSGASRRKKRPAQNPVGNRTKFNGLDLLGDKKVKKKAVRALVEAGYTREKFKAEFSEQAYKENSNRFGGTMNSLKKMLAQADWDPNFVFGDNYLLGDEDEVRAATKYISDNDIDFEWRLDKFEDVLPADFYQENKEVIESVLGAEDKRSVELTNRLIQLVYEPHEDFLWMGNCTHPQEQKQYAHQKESHDEKAREYNAAFEERTTELISDITNITPNYVKEVVTDFVVKNNSDLSLLPALAGEVLNVEHYFRSTEHELTPEVLLDKCIDSKVDRYINKLYEIKSQTQ